MFKQISLITFAAALDAASRAAFVAKLQNEVAAEFCHVGAALPASHRGGDVVWHLHFADAAAWRASNVNEVLDRIAADPAVAELDAAAYEVARFGVQDSGLRNGVYRALLVSVDVTAPDNIQKQFADELAGMPVYISEIVNWGMHKVIASRGELIWTHVWEQEFRTVDGLIGPYMTNAYHWAFVDRWFDAEMPEQIVANGALRHSASAFTDSVMAHYLV